ncbi:hypothetical protein HK101_004498 [Irineochytrium annulatum]|nr:hypothetical protein HK101_004498 [Irineochytrium annulatum]
MDPRPGMVAPPVPPANGTERHPHSTGFSGTDVLSASTTGPTVDAAVVPCSPALARRQHADVGGKKTRSPAATPIRDACWLPPALVEMVDFHRATIPSMQQPAGAELFTPALHAIMKVEKNVNPTMEGKRQDQRVNREEMSIDSLLDCMAPTAEGRRACRQHILDEAQRLWECKRDINVVVEWPKTRRSRVRWALQHPEQRRPPMIPARIYTAGTGNIVVHQGGE